MAKARNSNPPRSIKTIRVKLKLVGTVAYRDGLNLYIRSALLRIQLELA